MRKITSIALLLLMSLQCFYQLGVITYFQLNREYIAEVLCINKEKPITMCYGQCFLDKNLELASIPDEGTIPSGKQRVDFPIFLVSENSYQFEPSLSGDNANSQYSESRSSEHTSSPFHPPSLS